MSSARDELAQIIAYNVRNGLAGEDVHTPYAEIDDAADAIIAAGYIKPDLTDTDQRNIMEEVLARLEADDREVIERALKIPDLYPARNIRHTLEEWGVTVKVADIYAWRKARGIKKATC